MDIKISTEPVFHLPLTTEHVHLLITLSAHHYDPACQAATKSFLARWNNAIGAHEKYKTDTEPFTVLASFTDVDLVLKLLEMRTALHRADLFDDNEARMLDSLTHSLAGATRLGREQYTNWQATFSG